MDYDYDTFVKQHENQLQGSGVPKLFWPTLFHKLTSQIFDSGDSLMLIRIEYEDDSYSYQVQVNTDEGIACNDPQHIYLVDHAWTFRLENARKQLLVADNLRARVGNMMAFDVEKENDQEAFVNKIMKEIWKYVNFYTIGNAEKVEDRLPVWYLMDEVGTAIKHNDDPNFRMIPFFYLPESISYSLIYPIKNLQFADHLTRDFVENKKGDERNLCLLPWIHTSYVKKSFAHVQHDKEYFLSGHIEESLPIIAEQPKTTKESLKVYSQYEFINKYLTTKEFELTDDEESADILWHLEHFKNFKELSIESPHKFINQFPFEYVLTVKDLLPVVSRILSSKGAPKWLPITYNLRTELQQFISYYQYCEENGLDNHWIIKPFNLARSLDTHITNNLNLIVRLVSTGPKIAQKYIERPVLFEWPDCGHVKFDVRYVLLLKSVKPLEAFVYKKFFLRFANKTFALKDLDDYERHFTVMNYNPSVCMKHLLCDHFKVKWEQQFGDFDWKSIEERIILMLTELLKSASHEDPPCGIARSPQSRALYAVDLMLEWNDEQDIQPKLLEVNWMPDCQRACEYYPGFYNDIFKLLFMDIKNESLFYEIK